MKTKTGDFIGYDDFIVCTGFPGEEHSLKEFITPNQVMVDDVRAGIAAKKQMADDLQWAAWDWVCRSIRYPTNFFGQFVDVHEWNAFGLRKIKSSGEFFQLPYQTLVARIGDCFDRSALLASILANDYPDVQVALGTVKGAEDINHAWVVTHRAGRDYVLETTLKQADAWVKADALPEYVPHVIFGQQSIRGLPDLEGMFCHPTADNDKVMRTIGGCWRCRMSL